MSETKEKREEEESSCEDTLVCAELSLSELVSVGRPPAHTGLWAAALGLSLRRPSFLFLMETTDTMGISLDSKHHLFNLHSERDGFHFLRKSNPFLWYLWNFILSAIPAQLLCLVIVREIFPTCIYALQ